MNITQRTDNRHAQAATMAAGVIPANLPDAKVDEYAMGMAMMRAARMEGHRGKAPSMQNRGSEFCSREVDAEILRVIQGEMTTRQITDAVSRIFGKDICIKTVWARLRGPLFDALRHRKAAHGVVWTMKQ